MVTHLAAIKLVELYSTRRWRTEISFACADAYKNGWERLSVIGISTSHSIAPTRFHRLVKCKIYCFCCPYHRMDRSSEGRERPILTDFLLKKLDASAELVDAIDAVLDADPPMKTLDR